MDPFVRKARVYSAMLLIVTLAYAALRHNVFEGIPWEMLPLYTLNKAAAWTGLSLLAVIFTLRYFLPDNESAKKQLKLRKPLGKIAFNILGLHALLTLLLFRTEYGLDFIWQEDSIRLDGVVSILLGSAALGFLAWYSKQAAAGNKHSKLFKNTAIILLMAGAMHAGIWGFPHWITPGNWPGYLPPVTLLSSLTAIIAFFIIIRKR